MYTFPTITDQPIQTPDFHEGYMSPKMSSRAFYAGVIQTEALSVGSFLTSIVFTATVTELTWTAGTIWYKGVVYNVPTGTTTSKYIYWSPTSNSLGITGGVGKTFFCTSVEQTVNTYEDRFLVGVYNSTAGTWSRNHSGTQIIGSEITTGTITADKITATSLSAIQANLGTVTIDNTGYLKNSGLTGYNNGTGFFLGYDTSAYKLFVGNSSGDKLTWDGTSLTITGDISSSSITAATVTGGTVQTSSSGARIVLTDTDASKIFFYDSDDLVGGIKGATDTLQVICPATKTFQVLSDTIQLYNSGGGDGTLEVAIADTTLSKIGRIELDGTTGQGYVEIVKQGSNPANASSSDRVRMFIDNSYNLLFKKSDGTIATVSLTYV